MSANQGDRRHMSTDNEIKKVADDLQKKIEQMMTNIEASGEKAWTTTERRHVEGLLMQARALTDGMEEAVELVNHVKEKAFDLIRDWRSADMHVLENMDREDAREEAAEEAKYSSKP